MWNGVIRSPINQRTIFRCSKHSIIIILLFYWIWFSQYTLYTRERERGVWSDCGICVHCARDCAGNENVHTSAKWTSYYSDVEPIKTSSHTEVTTRIWHSICGGDVCLLRGSRMSTECSDTAPDVLLGDEDISHARSIHASATVCNNRLIS